MRRSCPGCNLGGRSFDRFFVLGINAAIQYCENHKETGILILPENEKEQVLVVGNLVVEF